MTVYWHIDGRDFADILKSIFTWGQFLAFGYRHRLRPSVHVCVCGDGGGGCGGGGWLWV